MLVNSESYNAKKIWRSLTSKDNKRSSFTKPFSRQSLKPAISQPTTEGNTTTVAATATKVLPQQRQQPPKMRQSFIESKRSSLRRSFQLSKHISRFELNFDEISTSDPKELEFYKNLFNPSSNNTKEDSFDEVDMTIVKEGEKNFSSDLEPERTAFKEDVSSFSIEENLQYALADYELYNSPLKTTTNQASFTDYENNTPAGQTKRSASSPSIPSLTSTWSIDSEVSVLNIRNSIWVGTIENGLNDPFTESDFKEIFDEYKPNASRHKRSSDDYHRTSLIFS